MFISKIGFIWVVNVLKLEFFKIYLICHFLVIVNSPLNKTSYEFHVISGHSVWDKGRREHILTHKRSLPFDSAHSQESIWFVQRIRYFQLTSKVKQFYSNRHTKKLNFSNRIGMFCCDQVSQILFIVSRTI